MRSIITQDWPRSRRCSAGCQVVGYAGSPSFDDPFVNDTIGPTTPPFPLVFYFPDNTMYFFPIYGTGRPVSDLDLLAFRCAARRRRPARRDGTDREPGQRSRLLPTGSESGDLEVSARRRHGSRARTARASGSMPRCTRRSRWRSRSR